MTGKWNIEKFWVDGSARNLAQAGLLAGVLAAVGCGGGGSSRSAADRYLQGVLLDSPVSGVSFQTATTSGTTDDGGTFSYQAGETVTFSLGSLELGSVAGDAEVTLFDLAGIDLPDDAETLLEQMWTPSGQPTAAQRVINLAVLLQTLDTDRNPDNGISIAPEVAQQVTADQFDLSLDYIQFGNGGNIRDGRGLPGLLRAAATDGILAARSPVPAAQALSHVLTQLGYAPSVDVSTSSQIDYGADGVADFVRRLSYDENGKVSRDAIDSDGDGALNLVIDLAYSEDLQRASIARDDDANGAADDITSWRYDTYGALVERVRTDGAGNVSEQELLTYDDAGRLVRRENMNASVHTIEVWQVDEQGMRSVYELDDDADGTIDHRSVLQYGEHQRGDLWIRRDIDSDMDGVADSRIERSYNALRQLTRESRDTDLDGTADWLQIQSFDAQGNQLSYELDNDGIAGIDFARYWSYDAQGNPLQVELDSDGDGTIDQTDVYSYDSQGNLIMQSRYLGGSSTPASITERTYDTNGNVLTEITDSDADGSADRSTEFTYDAQGRLVEISRDSNGDGMADQRNSYGDYVSAGLGAWL